MPSLCESVCLVEGSLKDFSAINECGEMDESAIQPGRFSSRMRTEIESLVSELDFSYLRDHHSKNPGNVGRNQRVFKLGGIDDFIQRTQHEKKERKTKRIPVSKRLTVPRQYISASTQAGSTNEAPATNKAKETPKMKPGTSRNLKSFIRTEDILVDL